MSRKFSFERLAVGKQSKQKRRKAADPYQDLGFLKFVHDNNWSHILRGEPPPLSRPLFDDPAILALGDLEDIPAMELVQRQRLAAARRAPSTTHGPAPPAAAAYLSLCPVCEHSFPDAALERHVNACLESSCAPPQLKTASACEIHSNFIETLKRELRRRVAESPNAIRSEEVLCKLDEVFVQELPALKAYKFVSERDAPQIRNRSGSRNPERSDYKDLTNNYH